LLDCLSFIHLSMINNLLFPLTLVSALGCGLIAGVFFAFLAFVMKALASLPTAAALAAQHCSRSRPISCPPARRGEWAYRRVGRIGVWASGVPSPDS
jgi:hypothetical protein